MSTVAQPPDRTTDPPLPPHPLMQAALWMDILEAEAARRGLLPEPWPGPTPLPPPDWAVIDAELARLGLLPA